MGKATEILNRRKKYGTAYVNAEYDTTQSAKSASDILKDRRINKYREELNSIDIKSLYDYKDFGLSEDKKSEYKTTISNYKTALDNLKKYDSSITEEDYSNHLKSLDSLSTKFDVLSKYKDEDTYNADMMDWLEEDYKSTPEKVKARRDRFKSNLDRLAEIDEEINSIPKQYTRGGGVQFAEGMEEKYKALAKEKDRLQAENNEYENTQGRTDSHFGVTKLEDFEKISSNRGEVTHDVDHIYEYMSKIDPSTWKWENGTYVDAFGTPIETDGNSYVHPESGKYSVDDPLGLYFDAVENDTWQPMDIPNGINDAYLTDYNNAMLKGSENDWNQLKPEEIAIYYYYLNTEGKDKAMSFLDDMTMTLNKRREGVVQENIANAEGFEKFMLNIASVPANIFGGVTALANDAVDALTGQEYNPYSYGHSMQNTASIIREETAKDFVEATGGASLLWMNAGDVYQALMSGVDSLAGAGMGGTAYGLFMGASSASSEMKRLYEEGASGTEMLAGGFLAGAAEMFFEKYSIDKFVKMGDSKTLLGIAANFFKQGGIEAYEEALTSIANTITDLAVRGNNSDISKNIDAYISQGMSQGEATLKALKDVGVDIYKSAMSGFISGGGMGGVASTANYLGYQAEATAHGREILENKGVPALKALADEVSGVTKGRLGKDISGLSSKVSATPLEGKNKLSTAIKNRNNANAIGRLSDMDDTARISQNTAEVESALKEKGLSPKEAKKGAEAIKKRISGEEVELNNPKVMEVYNELTGEGESQLKQTINERNIQHTATRLGIDTKNRTVDGKSIEKEVSTEGRVAESGKTTRISTGEEITIDKSKPIAKTKTVDGVDKVFFNTDKGVVEASDITYANENEALIYESFTDLHPSVASAAIKAYDGTVPAQTYINGMREGILLYGKHNFQAVGKDISVNSSLAQLSSADQALALKLGKAVANIETSNADKALKSAVKSVAEKAKKDIAEGKNTARKGTVRYENGVKPSNHSQKRAVALAKHLASAIGIDIVFYDARTTTGKGKGANGYYENGTIYLDLQKSNNDSHTIAFTLSHELVHFVKEYSPAKFKVFADFLMEEYAKHGVSTSTLLANKMAELNLDPDEAYEEMIADACERMLLDSNVMLKLAKLKKIDLDLFEKIRLHILDILNKIRAEYKRMNYAPTSDEAKALLKMEDVIGKLHEKFEEMVVDATENFQALDTESVKVSENGTIMMQMKQYETTGRDTLLKYLRRQYGKDNANDLISTIDNLYNTMVDIKKDTALSVFGNWQEQEVELDENGHPIFTTSINNGDYVLNQDFSRVCKKRRQLNFVLNMLAEDPAFEASNLTRDDIVKINKVIKKHGFEIACALCFVDSKRFRQTEWADSFANTWNDILGSMKADSKPLSRFNFATKSINMNDEGIKIDTSKPITFRKWSEGEVSETKTYKNLDDLLKNEGNANVRNIAKLIRDNNNLRHEFRGADIIASDGFDMIQRLAPDVRDILDGWGGTSVPKPSSNDAIYDNSILNIKSYNAPKAFAIGGVRMNSFSDFMAHMFFDYAQAFADLSAKKLPMHSYTKELDFARLFGLTKGKINMSAIAAIRENATDLTKIEGVANKKAATKWEKSIAGLDISKLADKLGKAEADITYDDVIQNLDDCEYVWADESIDVQSATLLQSGIMYDNLTEGKAVYCYELIKEGKFDEAFKIAGEENVNREYAKHLGIITVGVSKAHILKLLRDPTIRMVIPYHSSGLNAEVAKALKIAFYEDFTDSQSTSVKLKNGKQYGVGSKSAKENGVKIKDFNFYDYFGKTIDGVFYDGKATTAKYLEWCEKGVYDESVGDYVYYLTGRGAAYMLVSEFHEKFGEIVPKFSEFAEEENYYKLIEDFDCYDTITGKHSSQEAVDFLREDALPADYKDVLLRALKAEQKVSDDFRDHLDNQGLRDEIMAIVGEHGYTPSKVKKQAKRSAVHESQNIVDHVRKKIEKNGKWKSGDVFEVLEGKNDINFIERIYAKDKTAKKDLASYLSQIDSVELLRDYSWFVGEAYKDKDMRLSDKKYGFDYPYRGSVTTFRNAIKKRINEIESAEVNGENLNIVNGEITLEVAKSLFDRLNSDNQVAELAEKVFATCQKLGVNIRFANQFIGGDRGYVGQSIGDMVELKTSYFNDTSQSNQKKASTILHELIHACTMYVLSDTATSLPSNMYDVRRGLGRIFREIQFDPNFASQYGIKDKMEMVAELSNPQFVKLLKEKSLWDRVLDFIGRIFGVNKGDKAYDNVMMCLDYILDNANVSAYKTFAKEQRSGAMSRGWNTFGKTRFQKKRDSYAPTFYSKMERVIDDIKINKMGAGGVVPYLTGKGVKKEEIKWSGIEAFLEGKKSLTKEELQEFVKGSQLQIEEEVANAGDLELIEMRNGDYQIVFDGDNDTSITLYKEDGKWIDGNTETEWSSPQEAYEHYKSQWGATSTRWSQYKLDGGENYREIVFTMPGSSYSNQMMKVHWGEDAEGVLVHARIQDFDVNGKKMLFVEEIQSDWHNEGHKQGYVDESLTVTMKNTTVKHENGVHRLYRGKQEMYEHISDVVLENRFPNGITDEEIHQGLVEQHNNALKNTGAVPDAPFRDNYHEYVLKRLIRMAAEEGYDSIGWTPADIQSERWSDEFAEGYRIEYDQDIPKFLKKYGKQWGATVGTTTLNNESNKANYIGNDGKSYKSIREWYESVMDDYTNKDLSIWMDYIAGKTKVIQDGNTMHIQLKQTGKLLDETLTVSYAPDTVWSMDITDTMKNSVLYEGQPKFQKKRDVAPITDDDTKKLTSKFGTTTNFDFAGYLLTNGKMLDFSGKHWGNSRPTGREVDHRDVLEAFNYDGPHNGNNGVDAMIDMIGGGNIRLMPEVGGINLAVAPNEAQRNVLLSYIRHFRGEIIVDIDEIGGDTIHSFEYNKGTAPMTVIRDIMAYFEDGTIPKQQPEYRQFLYQKKKPSNRELLSNALESTIDTSSAEGKVLQEYKNNIGKIEELEAHLAEVKTEIYKLSFGKGARDTARLKELNEDKVKTANRINIYDKKLLRIEATKPLKDILVREKEKVRKAEKQKGEEALRKLREKDAATLREVMERNQESRRKNVEGRQKTEMRNKIKGVVGNLNKMFKAGRKKANVKAGMRDTVAQALATAELLFSNDITNEDIVRNGVTVATSAESKKLNRYMDLLSKRETYLNKIDVMMGASLSANIDEERQMVEKISKEIRVLDKELKDVFERERNRLNEVVISSAIQDLADAYKSIKDSEQSYISAAYNEYVYDRLLLLKDEVGGSSIRDMSMDQLRNVYEAYKMVLHVVRTANTLFKDGKAVDDIADAVVSEIKSIAKPRNRSVPTELLNRAVWGEMKPRTAFEKIGSDTLLGLYDNLRKGEDTFAMDVYEAFEFANSARKRHNYKKWDMKSRIDFKLESGKTFSVNLQQLMSIYAYSKREQAHKHMTNGGFVFDSKETFTKKKSGIIERLPTAETYRLSANDISKIINTLAEKYSDAKAYVDEMQKYLTDMGEKGNEVSRLVFGIDLFKEKVYFPLQSSRDYLRSNNDALDKKNATPSLINSGMTKETIPNAENPIVLSGFDNVWASHTNKMSLYHSFVPALEDFRKVYEYSSSAKGADYVSVRAEITNVFGANATDYIGKFIDDVNGGMPGNEMSNPIMSLFSTFKKTSVGMSLSTVIQQPTAIIRAWSILNPKYFAGVPHNNFSSAQWDEIKRYAPIAILKEIGGFDAGSGRGMVDYLAGDVNKTWLKKTSATIDDASMWLAGKGDVLGWGMIWNAVKREVADTTNLTEDSEEFLEKCGERFTEVITETQVYDSTFSRSGYMRSKNELNKFATSFMAEPTTAINMLYRAVINAKRGKISKAQAVGTIASVVLSQFMASALVSLIYAARDDDEDESYLEKYFESLGSRIRDDINVLNMLPYLRDIQSLFDGWDVERPDMAIFADIKKAYDGLQSKTKSPYMKWRDFISAISNAFGVPLGNLERDLRAVFYNVPKMLFDDATPTFENSLEAFGDGLADKDTSMKERAWNAHKKGDTSKVKRTVAEMIEAKVKSGKTEKEAKSDIRSSFTLTYKKIYLDALDDKDHKTMNDIRKFLFSTGLYGSLSELDKSLENWRKSK